MSCTCCNIYNYASIVTERFSLCLQSGEIEKKYSGLLEKKWTSVIRLQKRVSDISYSGITENSCISVRVLLYNATRTPYFEGEITHICGT